MVGQRRNAPVSSFLEEIILKKINIGRKTQPVIFNIFHKNTALLLDFLALFGYTARMPLFCRISPGDNISSKTYEKLRKYSSQESSIYEGLT